LVSTSSTVMIFFVFHSHRSFKWRVPPRGVRIDCLDAPYRCVLRFFPPALFDRGD
jgi:hypothetical protein